MNEVNCSESGAAQRSVLDRFVMQVRGLRYDIEGENIALTLNVLGTQCRDYITEVELRHTDNLLELLEDKTDQMHKKILYA